MTLPNLADPSADYGMPAGGFADYGVSPTDPTTDWTSGNPPNQTNTGGPGANQMIVDVAGLTRVSTRAFARFTAGTTPAIVSPNGHDAVWGNDSSVKPTPAHTATGTWTLTWPTQITDTLGVIRQLNLRWAKVRVEGSTLAFAQCVVTSPNVVTVYGWNSAGAPNDLTGITLFVEAG